MKKIFLSLLLTQCVALQAHTSEPFAKKPSLTSQSPSGSVIGASDSLKDTVDFFRKKFASKGLYTGNLTEILENVNPSCLLNQSFRSLVVKFAPNKYNVIDEEFVRLLAKLDTYYLDSEAFYRVMDKFHGAGYYASVIESKKGQQVSPASVVEALTRVPLWILDDPFFERALGKFYGGDDRTLYGIKALGSVSDESRWKNEIFRELVLESSDSVGPLVALDPRYLNEDFKGFVLEYYRTDYQFGLGNTISTFSKIPDEYLYNDAFREFMLRFGGFTKSDGRGLRRVNHAVFSKNAATVPVYYFANPNFNTLMDQLAPLTGSDISDLVGPLGRISEEHLNDQEFRTFVVELASSYEGFSYRDLSDWGQIPLGYFHNNFFKGFLREAGKTEQGRRDFQGLVTELRKVSLNHFYNDFFRSFLLDFVRGNRKSSNLRALIEASGTVSVGHWGDPVFQSLVKSLLPRVEEGGVSTDRSSKSQVKEDPAALLAGLGGLSTDLLMAQGAEDFISEFNKYPHGFVPLLDALRRFDKAHFQNPIVKNFFHEIMRDIYNQPDGNNTGFDCSGFYGLIKRIPAKFLPAFDRGIQDRGGIRSFFEVVSFNDFSRGIKKLFPRPKTDTTTVAPAPTVEELKGFIDKIWTKYKE